MHKRLTISSYLRNFRETKNLLSLIKAMALIVRQQRIVELVYGGYCGVVYRPSAVGPCEDEAALASILARKGELVHPAKLSREHLIELYGDAFAIHALPADFTSTRYESVCRDGGRLVVGEYGAHARLAVITSDSCVINDYYEHIPGIKHIHAIQRYGDSGEFLVSTGDGRKFLDLWVLSHGAMSFARRLRPRLAGYTAAVQVNGEYFFGSDFTSRPNYIETLAGTKYFFPDKAYKLRADLFYPFFDRYIAVVSKDLEELTGRRTLSVFDTAAKQFIYCDDVNVDATRPPMHPDEESG